MRRHFALLAALGLLAALTPALAEWKKPQAAPPMSRERQREWATNPGLLGFTEGVMTLDDPCNGGKHPHLTKAAQWYEFCGYVIPPDLPRDPLLF
jgi:hypothetical protein